LVRQIGHVTAPRTDTSCWPFVDLTEYQRVSVRWAGGRGDLGTNSAAAGHKKAAGASFEGTMADVQTQCSPRAAYVREHGEAAVKR